MRNEFFTACGDKVNLSNTVSVMTDTDHLLFSVPKLPYYVLVHILLLSR